ncbi:MAG: PsbP-related protein [Patescibacteria group bacterium]
MDDINQQPPIPQQTPVQSEMPLKTSNSNWLRTLAIGFGIASIGTAIAVGGYFLGTKNSQPATENKVISRPSPTPTLDPTANWKTYTNAVAGYSFKYPNDYQVMENQKKSVDGVTVNVPNTTVILSSVLPNLNTNMQIGIHYENQLNNLSGDEVAKKFGLSTNPTIYTIDGKSGFIFTETPLGPYGSTIIYIIRNNKSYTFTIESQVSYAQYKQYLDQILSTFRFAN